MKPQKINIRKEKIRLWLKCFFREWVVRPIGGGRNHTPNKVKNKEMNDLMLTLLNKIENHGSMFPYGYDVVIHLEDYAVKVWVWNRPYADARVSFYERKSSSRESRFAYAYVESRLQFNGVVREKLREVIYPNYAPNRSEGREQMTDFDFEFEMMNPNEVNPELIKRMIASYELSLL